MTPNRRYVNALLVMSVTAALLGTGTVPSYGEVAALSAQAEEMTQVTLIFDSCKKCTVTAGQYIVNQDEWEYLTNQDWQATVVKNRATFTVPKSATIGMNFAVSSRYGAWPGGNAVPLIALGFKGKQVGGKFSKAIPMSKKQKANWCWAGTSEDCATIRIRSHRMTVKIMEPYESPKQALFWAAPTVQTWHDELNMQKGMGTQQLPPCYQPIA